jgi:hypothetical protein
MRGSQSTFHSGCRKTSKVGLSQVAHFDWTAPGVLPGAVWLLAIITAANDLIQTSDLNVNTLWFETTANVVLRGSWYSDSWKTGRSR